MTCYQAHSLNIFTHVRSANRCFEGVIHSICFVNKKLKMPVCFCLVSSEEGRQVGQQRDMFRFSWKVDQPWAGKPNYIYYFLVPLSPSFTLYSAGIHKKPAFYWSKSQMWLCSYAKRLQVYQNLKSIHFILMCRCWTLLIWSESCWKIIY